MRLFRSAFSLALLVSLAACAAPAGVRTTNRAGSLGAPSLPAVRVGLLLPLSAPQSGLRTIAQSMRDAAQLALFDAYNSPPILLIVRDTKGTKKGAAAAARGVLGAGVKVILGPLLAESARAAHRAVRSSGVPVISFSSDRTIAGNGLYTLGFPPEDEITRIVRYAAGQNLKRIAAFLPRTDYGRRVRTAFVRAAEENAVEVHAIETYTPEIRAAFAPAQRLADFTWRKDKLAREQARLRADILRMEDRFVADDTGSVSFEGDVLPRRGVRGGRRVATRSEELPRAVAPQAAPRRTRDRDATTAPEPAPSPARKSLDPLLRVHSSEFSPAETAMLAEESLAFTLAFVDFIESFRRAIPAPPPPPVVVAPTKPPVPTRITRDDATIIAEVDLETRLGDTGAVLKKLERLETFGAVPYDAVLLAEGEPLLNGIAQLLPSFDITRRDVRFLGTGLWQNPALQRELPLIGGWFAAPNPAARKTLEARFRRSFDRVPPRIASLAYDAVSLVAALIDTRGRFNAAGLRGTGFRGIDGVFQFTRKGSAVRGLAIIENQRSQPRVLEPAGTIKVREAVAPRPKSPRRASQEQAPRAADTP